MPVNDTTTNRSYQKPNIANTLSDDVGRLRSALDAIDTDMAGKAETNQTMYIGTTAVAINRTSASLALTGVSVANSATTATSANTVNAIVARDASGNFSAGTITASLTGTASSASNLAGGSQFSIPYQASSGSTQFIQPASSNNSILRGVINGQPSWISGPSGSNQLFTSGQFGTPGWIPSPTTDSTVLTYTTAGGLSWDIVRFSVGTLSDSATITPNFAAFNHFTVTLAGNRVLGNPTNQTAGQFGSIFIVQDAFGQRTLSYGPDWKFAGGTAPTLSTAANSVDQLDYVVRASGIIHAVLTKGYA